MRCTADPRAHQARPQTYAGVLAEAGRNDVDHKVALRGEILKKPCLAETAPLSATAGAVFSREHPPALHHHAPAMAHQLLGVPAAPAPARPARAVEMWLADARTGGACRPRCWPSRWRGHPGVRAETCSTPAARAHGEMTNILDVNFRVMQSRASAAATEDGQEDRPAAGPGFPHLVTCPRTACSWLHRGRWH